MSVQDVPYLDVAPYMPEYYKPHNLLDFEERLPSSDSLSLHSFTSLTSTNLEWDDSAIAPSSEGKACSVFLAMEYVCIIEGFYISLESSRNGLFLLKVDF